MTPIKLCQVCGDVAKSQHFGGLCCESCKSFFRRGVHNDNYLDFYCSSKLQYQCRVSLTNRKQCRSCRMTKCFAIGMEKSWVRSEDECRALMKSRKEKKMCRQLADLSFRTRTNQLNDLNEQQLDIETMPKYLTMLEIKEIKSIVAQFSQICNQVQDTFQLNFDRKSPQDNVREVLRVSTSRLTTYVNLLKEFTNLNWNDQTSLLKHGLPEMCFLRGVLVFNPSNKCWLYNNKEKSSVLYLNEINQLVSPHLLQMHLQFILNIRRLDVDEPIVMLMILIVLFTPERMGVVDQRAVEKHQQHFTCLLDNYTKWRYGIAKSRTIFATLLTKLSDLRILSESQGSFCYSELINNMSLNFPAQSNKDVNEEVHPLAKHHGINQPSLDVDTSTDDSNTTASDCPTVIDFDFKVITDLINPDESFISTVGNLDANLSFAEGELDKILAELI